MAKATSLTALVFRQGFLDISPRIFDILAQSFEGLTTHKRENKNTSHGHKDNLTHGVTLLFKN